MTVPQPDSLTPQVLEEDRRRDPPRIELDALSDAELANWIRRTSLAWARCRRFTLRRGRWRRANSAATLALGARLQADAGVPGSCDVCGRPRPTHHQVLGMGNELRFAHYCSDCVRRAPSGWFSASTAGEVGA